MTTSLSQAFQYDPLNRLEDAQGDYGHQAFAYDENGNRETFTQDGVPESLTYDTLSDQLEEKETQSRTYDLAGNTVTRGDDNFTYDDRNRLVSVTVDGTTTTYHYNGTGERTQKTTNGESRHFLYGKGGKLLMERDGDNLNLRQYVYLDDRPIAVFDVERQLADTPPAECGGATVSLTDLTVGTDETLACTASTELTTGNGAQEIGFNISAGGQALLQAPVVRLLPNTHIQAGAELHISPTSVEDFEGQYRFSSNDIYYLHTDHLNTTRAITDSGQGVVWRWDSDPFGASTPTSNGFVFNQRFPGQYYDEESGLHYNYFRDYDPTTGRYIESDLIGLGGGLNTYGYASGNPINLFDPNGLRIVYIDKRLKEYFDKIYETTRGKQIINQLECSENYYTITVNNSMPSRHDPSDDWRNVDIQINMDYPIRKKTADGTMEFISTTRTLAHELGHAVGYFDSGADEMDNIRANENPIMMDPEMPLNERWERAEY